MTQQPLLQELHMNIGYMLVFGPLWNVITNPQALKQKPRRVTNVRPNNHNHTNTNITINANMLNILKLF